MTNLTEQSDFHVFRAASEREPDKKDVDAAFYEVAARTLDGQPTGASVRISQCTAFKKMGFWWVLRVHGWQKAFRQIYRDWRTH